MDDHLDSVIDHLCATAEAMGVTLSPSAALVMAGDLAEYPLAVVTGALKACRRECRGRLTLADILQRAQSSDGRPQRDEAWSIALSADEVATVVLTDEILSALQVARPLLEARDKVAARMAFVSAYDRLVASARDEGQRVNWTVSLGYDSAQRAQVIQQAVDLKRLPQAEGNRLMLQHHIEPVTGTGSAIAGLITGNTGKPTAEARERLQAIRDELAGRRQEKELTRRNELQKYDDALREQFAKQMAIAEGKDRG